MGMQYGTIPGVDKPVSRLVQGTVMIGSENIERSYRLLDEVFELGCRRLIGAWLWTRRLRANPRGMDGGAGRARPSRDYWQRRASQRGSAAGDTVRHHG